jgi:aldehyde:ferredoxin oxidoreductase
LDDFSLVTDLLEALYGGEWTREQLFRTARGTLRSEIEFNRRAGLEEENDLPDYFRTEPLEPTGNVFDVERAKLQKLTNWSSEE